MINKISSNVFQFYFKQFGSCVYLIRLENKNILIDTSSETNQQELISDLKKLKILPTEINIVILTHSHWDHTENLNLFTKATIISSYNSSELPSELQPKFKIIKTP